MLGHFVRRLAYKIRRKLDLKTMTLNGIKLTADLEDVPKEIRKQLCQKNMKVRSSRWFGESLTSDDRVLEVDAGIGFIGIACAKICGEGNILSYEPNPGMQRAIEKTTL